jgi:hypothetical protein
MLSPMQPRKKDRYSHELYKEAWPLMQPRQKKVASAKTSAPKGRNAKAGHGSAGKER